jgi:hypothetical protein
MAVAGVIFEEVCHDFDSPDVVDGNDIHFPVIALTDGPVNQTADTPKSIYANSNCHIDFSFPQFENHPPWAKSAGSPIKQITGFLLPCFLQADNPDPAAFR